MATDDRALPRIRRGDWIDVHIIGGGSPRHGQVLEVLGGPGHEHYRVRWDEEHESIHYPSEGTRVVPPRRPSAG
jgi:hypothetical protein